jgi:BASS family bile acid:Na+ symporter
MSEIIKSLTLPVALIVGSVFSGFFARFAPATPYLIFVMLFVTFCRIDPSQMKFSRLHLWLLVCQVAGSVAVYLVLRTVNETLAQGVMVCVIAPTATSAAVIAGMLGANIATMATYSLLSNVTVAIAAPVIFSLVGTHAEMPFMESFLIILKKVAPLLALPFVAAFLLRRVARRAYDTIGRYQIVSFYMWAFALMTVSGLTVEFIKTQRSADYAIEMLIAFGALIACLAQFLGGRALGRRYGDVVAGGQSLGQKNTVLTIWMAQTYLSPIASIGPASYVLWQNLANSWQLWRKRKRNTGKDS